MSFERAEQNIQWEWLVREPPLISSVNDGQRKIGKIVNFKLIERIQDSTKAATKKQSRLKSMLNSIWMRSSLYSTSIPSSFLFFISSFAFLPCFVQSQQYPNDQFRHHHPVGNYSSAATTFSNQNAQSVYLNIGQILPQYIGAPSNSYQQLQQRTIFYPCLSRCQPNRWTYRWSTANIHPHQPQSPNPAPSSPPAPSQPIQPPQQPNVHHALIRLIFPSPSQPNPFQTASTFMTTTTTTQQPTSITTTTAMTTTMASTTSSDLTTSTANPVAYFRTISSTYELPTPPPYTQNGPGVPDTIVRLNPCPQGQPLMNEFHNPMTCNFVVKPNGGCPEHYWCHTGSSFETTTCCPNGNLKDRCQLPRSNGQGEDLIPRWYFDSGQHKCKRFLYKGMHGNSNNFVTAMTCAEACETAEQAAAVRNPCSIGPPARDLTGQQFICGVSDSRCPAGYYCHLGETAQANICCELSAAATDRCNLAVRQGEGSANLRRFYYNTLSRKCVEFVYRGTKGNENNFLTMDECKTTCEKLPNPCPMLFDFGERKECIGDERRCGKNEWCHLGSSRETTACCPAAAVDPCKLPLDLGQGVENLTRWYGVPSGDPCTRECRPFQYRGMKGNQNNFQSKAECEASCKADCPIALNPCADQGELLLDPEGHPQRCNATGQCPTDYWCHIGANPETTVCCSGVARACTQPLTEGFGNAVLSRWYYNANERNCQKFIYRGIGGNQNNYVDYEDCMNACPDNAENNQKQQQIPTKSTTTAIPVTTTSTRFPVVYNPCGSGEPLQEANVYGELFRCSPDKLCPDTHFCHISDEPSLSNQCCPKNGDPCEQPFVEGEGPSRLKRFYFDSKRGRCHQFVYRGAGGNANNFLSKIDCEYVCLANIQTPSAGNGRINPCPSGQPLMTNGGDEPLVCGGTNENAGTGSSVDDGCPFGYWCHVGSSPESTNCCPQNAEGGKHPCDLPLEMGNGTERLDRWYYDETAQACRRFWYTGLRGNSNNFISRDQCQQQCLQLLVNLAQGQSSTAEQSATSVIISNDNFCLRGEPLRDANGKVQTCGPEKGNEGGGNECPDSHFCHLGLKATDTGCCPRNGLDRCLLPLNRGLAANSNTHIRWYFNSATRRCEAFDYAGIKGNENNFVTKRHCEEHCVKPTKTKLYCPHGEPKWTTTNGIGKSLDPLTCGADKDCPEGFICHLSAEAGTAICCENPSYFCLQPRDPGPCKGDLIRYGYNPLMDTCVSYRYGGCEGTMNKFESMERCTEICCRQYRNRRK